MAPEVASRDSMSVVLPVPAGPMNAMFLTLIFSLSLTVVRLLLWG